VLFKVSEKAPDKPSNYKGQLVIPRGAGWKLSREKQAQRDYTKEYNFLWVWSPLLDIQKAGTPP
jgi:hypothetical protein